MLDFITPAFVSALAAACSVAMALISYLLNRKTQRDISRSRQSQLSIDLLKEFYSTEFYYVRDAAWRVYEKYFRSPAPHLGKSEEAIGLYFCDLIRFEAFYEKNPACLPNKDKCATNKLTHLQNVSRLINFFFRFKVYESQGLIDMKLTSPLHRDLKDWEPFINQIINAVNSKCKQCAPQWVNDLQLLSQNVDPASHKQ